ncbi:MAG: SH3 domain-containing protein [Pseudomonadota bacterium]
MATVCNDSDGWVYVREGPGKNYDWVARIPVGVKVELLDTRGDWYQISGAYRGYMHRSRLCW